MCLCVWDIRGVRNLHSCQGRRSSNGGNSCLNLRVCECVLKNVRQGEGDKKSPSICVWCVAGSVFSSVLRYFGIILLDDTLAQTHGEDHPKELHYCHTDTDSQNNATVFQEPFLHASHTARLIDGRACRQVLTQADMLDVRARQGLIATGTWVEVLGAVLDQNVLRPVARTSPSTALHRPLNVVPGVLCGPVLASVVDYHALYDVGHLIFQPISLKVNENSSSDLGDEDEQEAGEVHTQQTTNFVDGSYAAEESHAH